MITAKEAREKIENLKTERGEREKKIAEEKILKAVEELENCCWLGIAISDITKHYLEKLEYVVEIEDEGTAGADTKISW